MDLRVLFDRQDRCYRFGDEISGRVAIDAKSDFTLSKAWVTYRWRTHGRGNRDVGLGLVLALAGEKTSLRAGEHSDLPFSFKAPNGPVTYHGRYLNVDWYIIAHAIGPRGRVFESEEDFLLLGGLTTGPIILGDQKVGVRDLPPRSSEELPISQGFMEIKAGRPRIRRQVDYILLPVTFVVALVLAAYLPGSDTYQFAFALVITVAVGILLAGLRRVIRHAYKRKLEVGGLWVNPTSVCAGGQVVCHVDFRAKGEVHLGGIRATLYAQESVTRPSGTTVTTDYHVVKQRTFERPFNERLSPGTQILIDCAVPVEQDASATFVSKNNRLDWFVKVQVDLKRWPDWVETFPITVLP